MRVEPIFDEGRLAAVPLASPLAERSSLSLEDLSGEVVALSPVGTTTLELWPVGARPTRTVQVTNTDEWLVAIASGEAVGVTAASTAAQHAHPGVRFVPLTGAPEITVSLVWPAEGAHPALRDFVETVRRCTTG
jgi:hypothetical protein